jgi:DNA-binding IclR family transcriptional regulator
MSKSLEKGIAALLFLSTRKSAGVTELASELKVNKSTAFRILDTFQKAGMVEKDKKTLRYRLGPAILGLSDCYYNNSSLIKVAVPVMKQLADDLHKSVHLCVLSNNNAVIVEQVFSPKQVQNTKIGNFEPLHCSAVGKCLLAFAQEKDREEMLSDNNLFEMFTEKTICNKDELTSEIQQILEDGYAVDNEEFNSGVKCVAVPIFGKYRCMYSVGISGGTEKMTSAKIHVMIPFLIKAANHIADKGWQ